MPLGCHFELRCICAHKYYILGSFKVVGQEIIMDFLIKAMSLAQLFTALCLISLRL